MVVQPLCSGKPHSQEYGQNKLDSMGVKKQTNKQRGYKVEWVGVNVIKVHHVKTTKNEQKHFFKKILF